MRQLQALIFDVDGTLADTEQDGHRVAFNQAFVAAGLDWNWSVEQYGELLKVTGGKERIRFYLQKYLPDFQPDLPMGVSEQDWIAGLHKSKTHYYTSLMQAGEIRLRPGVRRLLAEARAAGLRLAIATTTTPANVTALLKAVLTADSLDWFEVIAAGDIVPAKKPAPDIYLYALEKMQLDPADCLAFEDSEAGLRSAQQANLTTVITLNDYTRAQDFTGAALVLDHLGEPDLPFEVIQGKTQASYFDLDLAAKLL
ncbi:MAG: HAD family hydrolase [Pegethrix bostrychoides GSE-TBD4-15B]|jgi:HAD superfamily hydrolase (TIGR01509 family)|uniref:HAD family hydrolase n=1 Tax=Pegethrix bostrychoides GSE-TBD4-15B TaxID=2839662 RepID=A0A951U707_9CYAN|nr:HAD family hydrolase [Pegethrix bostrychoides GSE-TBD4-15B]